MANTEEANAVKDQLAKVGKLHFPTSKNRDCMFAAYLANLNVPEGYDVVKFCRQITEYGAKIIDFFHDKILLEGGVL